MTSAAETRRGHGQKERCHRIDDRPDHPSVSPLNRRYDAQSSDRKLLRQIQKLRNYTVRLKIVENIVI